jgi:hypothetical protein
MALPSKENPAGTATDVLSPGPTITSPTNVFVTGVGSVVGVRTKNPVPTAIGKFVFHTPPALLAAVNPAPFHTWIEDLFGSAAPIVTTSFVPLSKGLETRLKAPLPGSTTFTYPTTFAE